MTNTTTSSKVHLAQLHNANYAPISCNVEQLSSSRVLISGTTKNSLCNLNIGSKVQLHIDTNLSQMFDVETEVERVSKNKAQLRYIEPNHQNIKKLSQWFKKPPTLEPQKNKPSTQNIKQLRPKPITEKTTSTPTTEKVAATPTIEKNTVAPKRANLSNEKIVEEFNTITSEHISALLDDYLEKAQSGLLKMAEVAENNVQQDKLFEALNLLRTHGDDIKSLSCNTLTPKPRQNEHQYHVTRSPITTNNSPSHSLEQNQHENVSHNQLELIDLQQFEDWLSLEKIIKSANEQYQHPLSCLKQRYSELYNKDVSVDHLPMSVNNIFLALQKAFKEHNFDSELLPVVYQFFDDSVLSGLNNLYSTLNEKFKNYGILPNIESQHPKHHEPITESATLHDEGNENKKIQTDEQPTPTSTSAPKLMSAVKHVQQLINPSQTEDSVDVKNSTPVADIIDQLTQLQHDVAVIDSLVGDLSLQQTLTTNKNIQLLPETQDQISLVDSIFNTLDTYPHLSKSLLSSFKRLQIPIAKVALMDPEFFSSDDHPARTFLNKIVDLSLNSEIPNSSLEQLFEKLIAKINLNYEKDNSIFQKASEVLTTTAEHQSHTYSKNTKRIIQTCEGRQLLKLATETVSNELHQRIPTPEAPQIIVDLIDNGWQELLKLTYLKEGPQSEDWIENLKIVDQLIQWLQNVDDKNRLKPNPQRISETDKFVDLIEKKLSISVPGDYRFSDTTDQLRKILKGTDTVEIINTEPAVHNFGKLTENLKSSKPELHRWFHLAEQVNVGDEFSYLDDNSGKKNIKLVWVSDDQQHFVFVNNRGQKVLDLDLFDLAAELSQGLIPVENRSELPLIERSLYSTIQQAYETLAFKSSHDDLTGLLNRKECERILGITINETKNSSHFHHSLLYVDIDQFSLVNDLHGHVAGDQQLVEIATLIKKQLPNNAVAARMAGNEFVILLKDKGGEQHITVAEDLRAEIENHEFKWGEHKINLTASIGLIVINEYTKNVIDLVRNAVETCKTAKRSGGNRFHDFCQDSEIHTRREKLLSWIDKLDHLLASDTLVLRGQAIVPTTENIDDSHYEILVALKNKHGKLISPAEFIEAAESYNRMQKVDRWVINKTFQWLNKIESTSYKMPSISINLSGNSLNDENFATFLLDEFQKYNLPPEKICFEVTETATINNIAEVANFIREIKNIGCEFSLDDFGSGNASYQYLRHLPVDYIKIDGMFVRDINNSSDDHALVKSINEIAHLMGKKTVAEYAENQSIIDTLKEIGVDYIQGYAVGMPTVLEEIQLELNH